jgi:hypothetical protein
MSVAEQVHFERGYRAAPTAYAESDIIGEESTAGAVCALVSALAQQDSRMAGCGAIGDQWARISRTRVYRTRNRWQSS